MPEYDVLIRNAYVRSRDAVVDVGIQGGEIAAVSTSIEDSGDTVLDADGNLLAPGFVDAHKHLDRGLAATGRRRPLFNDEPNASPAAVTRRFDEYFREHSLAEVTDRVAENLRMAIAAGTTQVRTHVAVDQSAGVDAMRAVLDAADRLENAVDLWVAPYVLEGVADPDSRERLETAIAMARDALETQVSLGGSITLVGGEPSMDIERAIDRWFAFASEHDLDIDVHVTPRGAAGYYALDRLAATTAAHDYHGRVTAVHAWGLAGLPEWWVDPLLERLGEAGVGLTVCYNSLRESMPIRSIDGSEVSLAHGTDNDRDFVYPHGNADSLEAAQIMSYLLIDEWHFPADYRWSETDPALETLWEAVTVGGADVLGLDDYGVEVGTPADLVLLDEPSPQWAIIARAIRLAVLKDGRIVARDGDLVDQEHEG